MTNGRECELIEDRLPPLLENDLPAGELILVRAHLDDCEHCASAFETLRAISDSIVTQRPATAWTEGALARAKHGIRNSDAAPSRVRSTLAVGAVAAFCVALFFVGPPTLPALSALADAPRTLLTDLAPIAARVPLPNLFAPDSGAPRSAPTGPR